MDDDKQIEVQFSKLLSLCVCWLESYSFTRLENGGRHIFLGTASYLHLLSLRCVRSCYLLLTWSILNWAVNKKTILLLLDSDQCIKRYCEYCKVYSSLARVHPLYLLSVKGHRGLEPIPAGTGQEAGAWTSRQSTAELCVVIRFLKCNVIFLFKGFLYKLHYKASKE